VSNSDDIRITAVVTLMGPRAALPHTFTGLVVLTLRALTLAVVGNAFAATIGTVVFRTGRETRDDLKYCLLSHYDCVDIILISPRSSIR
jgi:hypothetical protein